MTQQHPITPPPELVQQWEEDWHHSKVKHIELEPYIAAQAAQWGADQELEACCEWVGAVDGKYGPRLRLARRPKPLSLKEQALKELAWVDKNLKADFFRRCDATHTIRRALEQLDD